jgi:hypothetical protein
MPIPFIDPGIQNCLLFSVTFEVFELHNCSFNIPPIIAIALSSGIPPTGIYDCTASNFWELGNHGAYARQNVSPDPGSPIWSPVVVTCVVGYNQNSLTFPTATSDWGWISGGLIINYLGYGAGTGLFRGQMVTPQFISSGQTLIISASGFLMSQLYP